MSCGVSIVTLYALDEEHEKQNFEVIGNGCEVEK